MTVTNPLLGNAMLPPFDAIRPEHVARAMEVLLARANSALETVTGPDFPAQWEAISRELDCTTEALSVAWDAVNHLNSVADTAELRAAYNQALPVITAFMTRLGSDERLYAKYRAIDVASLNAEQRQAHKNAIRNFVLGGAELSGAQRTRFAEIQEQLAALSQKFSENTLDATDAFSYLATEEEMKGIPLDVAQTARAAAQREGKHGCKLTLKMPCYLPVMQYADSSHVRATMFRALVTRASDQAEPEVRKFDNAQCMRDILSLRKEEAILLGFANYGCLSLAPKMADSPDTVIRFLRDLSAKARPYAQQDIADMAAFARAHLGLQDPEPWDWPYIGEKLKQARYAFSEQETRQYFTLPNVLAGLFRIIETLFDVQIFRDQAAVWNANVEFYRLERKTAQGTVLIGHFYFDPSARDGKRGGAWMADVRGRWLRPDSGTLQTPVAHLVCNFADSVEVNGVRQPALLSHRDVITLFHEAGHGLQHLLTQVNEHSVAGINGVEWDAVELPSQFMENFCWEWDVLRNMTAHVDTGEPLPRALYDKMLAARNFQSGLQTLRQVEFALFDMLLHTAHDPETDFLSLQRQVCEEVAVVQPPAWSRIAHTFSHIFAGGYAAGYYSYKWAEVLSADAYAAFEEAAAPGGLPSSEIGRKYRETILEVGGSRPAMESFKAFRGREPVLNAWLRHQGLAA